MGGKVGVFLFCSWGKVDHDSFLWSFALDVECVVVVAIIVLVGVVAGAGWVLDCSLRAQLVLAKLGQVLDDVLVYSWVYLLVAGQRRSTIENGFHKSLVSNIEEPELITERLYSFHDNFDQDSIPIHVLLQ